MCCVATCNLPTRLVRGVLQTEISKLFWDMVDVAQAKAKVGNLPVAFTWKGEGVFPSMHAAFAACEAALK